MQLTVTQTTARLQASWCDGPKNPSCGSAAASQRQWLRLFLESGRASPQSLAQQVVVKSGRPTRLRVPPSGRAAAARGRP